MLLKQFPDISWLRTQAQTNFNNKQALGKLRLPAKGWPNVVLNTQSAGAERTGIVAPFSIFMNFSGSSTVKAESKEIKLTDDNFCLVNQGQIYDLLIPENESTTTFNIHLGNGLITDVQKTIDKNVNYLLDNPDEKTTSTPIAEMQSLWKSDRFKKHIEALKAHYAMLEGPKIQDDTEYELLTNLLANVFSEADRQAADHLNISSQKASTRQEIVLRLQLSLDYIHAYYRQEISLDLLSQIACMSKYHYLRSFKEAFQCTPQQMVAQLRLQKAEQLIIKTNKPLSEISVELGFSELASFSRFFTKHRSVSPRKLRGHN